MNKEDKEFLKNLQHEMLTQDTVAQANPRFWVVVQTVREYWVDDENDTDGICIYDVDNGSDVFEGEIGEELGSWIKEEFDDIIESYEIKYGDISLKHVNGEEICIFDKNDLKEFLGNYSVNKYSVSNYRNRDEVVQNTMFLTLRECKEHIEANEHRYEESAHPYAMTAWRSPQVERLYKILENTDWENI